MSKFVDDVIRVSSDLGYKRDQAIKKAVILTYEWTFTLIVSLVLGIYCFIVGKKVI